MPPTGGCWRLTLTGVYWHWDLRGTGLNVYRYRAMLLAAAAPFGFQVVPTDEPDVQEHPANFLIVRIGGNAPPATVKKFYRLCFMGRGASSPLRILPHKNGQAGSD